MDQEMNEASGAPLIRRAEGILAAAVGDEILMMSVAEGKYFNLNDVGTRIWELLEQPRSVEALVAALTEEYAVDDDTARDHVLEFLSGMRQRGLLA